MRIGVMSDSHDDMVKISQAVELFNRENVDLVLHAGDFVSAATAKEFKKLEAKLVGVLGNAEEDRLTMCRSFAGIGQIYRGFHGMEIGGRRVALMHQLSSLPVSSGKGYDAIIYGHTHHLHIDLGPPLVVNPGESCGRLSGRSMVVIIDLETLVAEPFELG